MSNRIRRLAAALFLVAAVAASTTGATQKFVHTGKGATNDTTNSIGSGGRSFG